MQARQYGHWEVVQTLILFKANIHRADYINGGTALHLAALNGHSRCIRLLLTDYIPSIPNAWNILSKMSENESSISEFDESALHEIINRPADGGITALHMAALNGHVETVQLLLDRGASVFEVTVEDGALFCVCSFTKRAAHFVIESTPFQPISERDIKRERWVLTEEGKTYAAARSPEVRVFLAGPPEGISLDELQMLPL